MLREAEEQFQKAIGLDAKNKEAYINLGILYVQAGKLDLALEMYVHAVSIDPKDGTLFNNIAVIYFEKGEYVLSWDYVRKAQDAGFSVHPDFLNELKKKIKNALKSSSGSLFFLNACSYHYPGLLSIIFLC
jgi:Tfp pilus assembly protein PilF